MTAGEGRSLTARLDAILHEHPAVGLAAGVVRGGRLEIFRGHGVTDIGAGAAVTEDTTFRIASITKTFTAIAVLQLAERGLVDLDAPAERYLRSYRLVPSRGARLPATVRQLLTHTAGLGEVAHLSGTFRPDFGESYAVGQALPTLAEFYGGALHGAAEPGTRYVYTNHGPATLGQIVQDVSGRPLADYLRGEVFGPLGMTATDLVRTPRVASRLATGYEIRGRSVRAVPDREMVTAGAAAAYSTMRDMARYVAALLAGGAGEHGAVLRSETVAQMFAPQYQPDPRIPGMGLAFFRSRVAGHPVVGHQGTHPGFHSQVSLAPDDGVGVILLTNGAHGADLWLPAAATSLVRELLAVPDTAPVPPPQRPEVWPELCGWYRLDAAPTDVRLRGMLGAGVEVVVRGGHLMMRFLTVVPALARGFRLAPDDAGDTTAFRIDLGDDAVEPIRVVFGRDGTGRVDRLCLDVMPLRLDKQPAHTNPRRWALGITGASGAAALTGRTVRQRERLRH